jgi:hypothetical protein
LDVYLKEGRSTPMKGEAMLTTSRRAGVVLFAMLLMAAGLGARIQFDSQETLRFETDTLLPGVMLPPGDYTFEVSHSEGSLVRVRAGRSDRVVFAGYARVTERPRGLKANKSIIFGQAGKGQPLPILGWFPRDRAVGYEFDFRTLTR